MSTLNSTGTNMQFQPSAEQPAPHSHALRISVYRICQDVSVTKQGVDIAVAPSSLPPSQSPIPVLPYTGPPPAKSRPRYSGGVPYPDLSLSEPPPEEHRYRDQNSARASVPITRSTGNRFEPYPSSSARTAQALRGQDSAASPVSPGRYGQVPMPIYADTSMPERQGCEWPDGRSLGGSQKN